ncbi:SURF1 family protein [Phytoactinopolyspora endophytica]|uniref:SURF1 family protein n=1 Tax=Phytoactinopolyspora endophytica TaxID=1642495 RepID=UPI0013EDB714|nr:SURF1 family protein [Phytoactinopolyspora endophytica]
MPRFLFTPRWLAAHVAFTLAIIFCVVAGWWQFGIYQDSQSRHDDRDRPAVPVSELVQPGENIADAADRPVTMEGRYLTEHALNVPGRIHDGVLGWFVLVPLETTDGVIVPVLRGWVDEPVAPATLPDQPVSTIGHLVLPETSEHATVRSGQILDDEEIAYIAPDTLSDATGISESAMLDGYLLLTSEEPAPDDIAIVDIDEVAPVRDVSPWQNLSYWAQWWVFGAAAVVFWASVVRSGIRSRSRATSTDGDSDESAGAGTEGVDADSTEEASVSEPAAPHARS